jgi:hypothetical protein
MVSMITFIISMGHGVHSTNRSDARTPRGRIGVVVDTGAWTDSNVDMEPDAEADEMERDDDDTANKGGMRVVDADVAVSVDDL